MKLIDVFSKLLNEEITVFAKLPESGSNRDYYRASLNDKTYICVHNNDVIENESFFYFTNHFAQKGMRVPRILKIAEDRRFYIIDDLGAITLYKHISEVGVENAKDIYKNVLKDLIQFQIKGNEGVDYTKCYPRPKFDEQSLRWDLNYFKYYFLKLSGVVFNEQEIEDDFNSLTNYLLTAENSFFMYRDFQSRNIMLKGKELFYIDYQGGRKGPLQYDVASLLYNSSAKIPSAMREELLDYYINEIQKHHKIDERLFKEYFNAFSLIRIMQAMGAYGYRGMFENKSHFLMSIPFALKNIDDIINSDKLKIELPHLMKALNGIISNSIFSDLEEPIEDNLFTINVQSFSYKKGLPKDFTGNGGGHVFDCRHIHNPGRYDDYKHLTGRDEEVINFFKEKSEIDTFVIDIKKIIDSSIKEYKKRGFKNLMISFGCTGGQHRSVFSAQSIYNYLSTDKDLNVNLLHRELGIKSNNKL